MMIVPLAEHVSMNVLLRQYQKATSIKLILMSALTVVHALMYALLRQFILNSISLKKPEAVPESTAFFIEDYILPSAGYPEHHCFS
jgi:hypothetical protein